MSTMILGDSLAGKAGDPCEEGQCERRGAMESSSKGLWRTTQIKVALAISALFIGAYVAWFVGKMGFGLSPRPEDWGYFGSYTAGTIGMAFALATVWMLAETLKTQREELRLTRDELELTREELAKSSQALESQVRLAEDARIANQFYYLIRAVDSNMETICNQNAANLGNREKVWAYGEGKVTLKSSSQIRAIVASYMFLLGHTPEVPTDDYYRLRFQFLIPMSLKYRAVLKQAYEDGYLSKYEGHELESFIHIINPDKP